MSKLSSSLLLIIYSEFTPKHNEVIFFLEVSFFNFESSRLLLLLGMKQMDGIYSSY